MKDHSRGDLRARITGICLGALAVSALKTGRVAAQQADSTRGGVVEVGVHDSLSAVPLPGATVQLVSATSPRDFSRTADTDVRGRVTFRGVPPGKYTVGFLHPILDSIGVQAPARHVVVANDASHPIALAIPSAASLRIAVCGSDVARDSSALMLGTVRDPRDGMPVAGVVLNARWAEFTIGSSGITRRTAGTATTSRPNGWFALCKLPAGTISLLLTAPGDTSRTIDLPLVANGFHRRDLYIGAPARGRARGRIVVADSGRAVAGAHIGLAPGLSATTDQNGAWTIDGVPLGTQMLEVRALGFHRESRAVDVVADEQQPLQEVALQSFGAILAAVQVSANRSGSGTAALREFADRRRRGGMGRFFDADALARRNPTVISDLLRTMPGFIGDGSLMMKGNFSDGAGGFDSNCAAEVYVDGHLLRGISASELDGLVRPEYVIAMEVYSAGSPKPAEFESGMSGCGAVVIWQKPISERIRRRP